MDDLIVISESDDLDNLSFDCARVNVVDAIRGADHEPNGYFWEGVVAYLAPELADSMDLDSEAGLFSAAGSAEQVEQLSELLAPLTSDKAAIIRVIENAEAAGFEFDD